VPEKRSPLQTIAFICVKLEQGDSEEKIKVDLDLLFSFCLEFALENNFLIKQENGTRLQTLEKNSQVHFNPKIVLSDIVLLNFRHHPARLSAAPGNHTGSDLTA
jgi:hypothetical protein